MRQVPFLMTVRMNLRSREQSQELFVRRTRSDRSQTRTRHVTHLILVTLLLVLVTHGRPHRGTVCFFQRQDYSFRGFRAQPTRGPLRMWIIQSFQEGPHIAWEQPSEVGYLLLCIEENFISLDEHHGSKASQWNSVFNIYSVKIHHTI